MTNKLWILLMIVLTGLLVACGGGEAPAGGGQEVAAEPTEPPATDAPSGDPVAGEQLYTQSCSSCHGADAHGVAGVGKDLTTSEFTAEMSDDEFLTFIKQGRPSGDPNNTTGIDMPPKGGNPALSDEDILHIIAYLRSIHQ